MRTCTVDGCSRQHKAKGFCEKHYFRNHVHGNPETLLRREQGTGTRMVDGRLVVFVEATRKLNYVLVAEKALGKPLPKGAVVHHVDGDPSNDVPSNLVICQDQAYHRLLHARTNALRKTGNANAKRCVVCGIYDDEQMLRKMSIGKYYHEACNKRRCSVAYQKRKLQKNNPPLTRPQPKKEM